MADKRYVVTAACAVVYHGDNQATTVHRGGLVPQDIGDDHLQVLLDRGLVEEAASDVQVGGLDPEPDATPAFVAPTDEQKTAAKKVAAAQKAD